MQVTCRTGLSWNRQQRRGSPVDSALRAPRTSIDDKAVEHIVKQTHGYPYFLQEWGYHAFCLTPFTST